MGSMAERCVDLTAYMTAEEAAKEAGITGRRIRQLCVEQVIEGLCWARHWFVRRESFYRWLQERQR